MIKIPSSITLDQSQKDILSQLDTLITDFAKNRAKAQYGNFKYITSILHILQDVFCLRKKRTNSHKGVYLYGSVGRGKTMLMKAFYNSISSRKKIVHYQPFMQSMHKEMHKLQSTKYANDMANHLAQDIAQEANILCIDELEIKDITDAMLMRRLLDALAKYNVFIFVTSNQEPDELYENGIQRESFLPCIDMIKDHYMVLYLDEDRDYRMQQIAKITDKCIYYNNNLDVEKNKRNDSELYIKNIKAILFKDHVFDKGSVNVFGRDVQFQSMQNDTLLTNFTELFERPLGIVDYVEISKQFKTIVLENVRPIAENEGDIITRFITFIDNAYFHQVQLFMNIKVKPSDIYIQGPRKDTFQRTLSRLHEMNKIGWFT